MIPEGFVPCSRCAGTGSVPKGERLRQLRQESGFTLKALAALLNVSQQYLCDIENARRAPTAEIIAGYIVHTVQKDSIRGKTSPSP